MSELLKPAEATIDEPLQIDHNVGEKALQSLEQEDFVESDAVRALHQEWESGSWDDCGDVYENIDQILPWQDLVELSQVARARILESEVDGYDTLRGISREFYQEHEEIMDSYMLETAVQRYLKAELYGDLEPTVQFYASCRLERALDSIQHGLELNYFYGNEEYEAYRDTLKAEMPGISPYYMHLYGDAMVDGELAPDPGPLLIPPQDEAIFILNQDIIQKYCVSVGSKYPMVDDYLDIEPYLMAILGKNEATVTALQETLAEEGYTDVKVYLQDDFNENPEQIRAEIDANYKAYQAKELVKEMARIEMHQAYHDFLANQVFEQVDQSAIVATIAPFVEKIDTDFWDQLVKQRATDMEAADRAAIEYLADVLSLQDEMKLKYFDDVAISWSGQLAHWKKEVRLNLARVNSDISALNSIAHEMFHEYQDCEADRFGSIYNPDSMNENWAELPRACLYEFNNRNYIEAEKDYEAYRGQLIEQEARAFADAIQKKKYRNITKDSREWSEQMYTKNESRKSSQGLGQRILRWLGKGKK